MIKTTIVKAYGIVFLLLFSHSISGQIDRPEFVPGQIIVKFKQDKSTTQRASLRHEMNASLQRLNPRSKAEVWEITQSQDIVELTREYQNHPDIEFLEPNYYVYLTANGYEKTMANEECIDTPKNTQEKTPSLWGKLKSIIYQFSSNRKDEKKNNDQALKPLSAVSFIPNDFQFLDQWSMHNIGQDSGTPNADIDAPEAWDIATGSPSVVIGLIDTGVDWTHPDLVNNIWQNLGEDADGDGRVLEWNGTNWIFDPGDINDIDEDGNGYIDDFIGWDFIDNDNDPSESQGSPAYGHGTHVAGTIGAEGNNGIGVSGVTWDVQLAALRVFEQQNTPVDVIVEAIDYAVMMDMPLSNNSYAEGRFSDLMVEALENAQNNEHLFIAAAGNFRNDNDAFPNYPSSYDFDNIISVVATDRSDQLWVQSNNRGSSFGAINADIGAPGDNIISTGPQNSYFYNTGTSMATPHVTGACALLIEQNPSRSYAEIKTALLRTADVLPDLDGNSVSGGRLNLHEALTYFEDSGPIPCRQRDSLALVAFYNATDGANWNTYAIWNLAETINNWYGVKLNESGCVKELNLAFDGLNGNIPVNIGNLTDLKVLRLHGNRLLIGDIPPEIGNLTNLTNLDLEGCGLSGSIPSELGNLKKLIELDLCSNELNGNIPVEIGNLTNLRFLDLCLNELNGSIPSEIGNLENLHRLDFRFNELSGSIPLEIGVLNTLEQLNLSNNQLTENIPKEIGNLTKLILFDLSSNQLSGNIPPEIGNLINLPKLILFDNQFTGNIPSEIGNLTKLIQLNLYKNQLNGSIPSQIGSLINLDLLDLSNNQLSGNIPSEIGNLKNLTNLYLNDNLLSGCYEANLLNLSTGSNQTIGGGTNNFDVQWETFLYSLNGIGACTIPTYPNCRENDSLALVSLFNSTDGLTWNLNEPINNWESVVVNGFGCVVRILLNQNNQLTGVIPSDIGNLTNLLTLDLRFNQLSGNIPSEIGNLTQLTGLNLNNNGLNGEIPLTIENLNNLKSLTLDDNRLSGSIPSGIGNLNQLSLLSLNNNLLTGSIPSEFANLRNLISFRIHQNQLNGCYSKSLVNLCAQLPGNASTYINFGNNFDAPWEDYCNNGAGTCTSQVWPGDYNNNGIADETDALYWGIAVGNTGDNRPNATTNWQGQEAPDWIPVVEGVNGKHQDGNGDGVVNGLDLQVLENNFGSIHDFNNPVYIAGEMIYQLVQAAPVSGRSSYDIYVSYRVGGSVIAHGLSGVIELGDWLVDDVIIDVNNSSLNPSDIFSVFDQVENRLHFALTRTDKLDEVCNGPIAKIIIDADNFPSDNSYHLDIKKGNAIQASGNEVKVTGTSFYPQEPSGLANNDLVVGASVMHEQCIMLGSITLNVEGGVPPYTYEWNTGAISNSLSDLTANIYELTVTDAIDEQQTLSVEVQGQYVTIPDEFGNFPDCIDLPCPTLITPDGTVTSGTYQASTAVNSIGNINGTVQFKAGEMILLREGFEVLQDKVFTAEIENCGNE